MFNTSKIERLERKIEMLEAFNEALEEYLNISCLPYPRKETLAKYVFVKLPDKSKEPSNS